MWSSVIHSSTMYGPLATGLRVNAATLLAIAAGEPIANDGIARSRKNGPSGCVSTNETRRGASTRTPAMTPGKPPNIEG